MLFLLKLGFHYLKNSFLGYKKLVLCLEKRILISITRDLTKWYRYSTVVPWSFEVSDECRLLYYCMLFEPICGIYNNKQLYIALQQFYGK